MDFVTTGPVLSLELMGVNSVKKWRYLLGKDSFSLKESCMYESVCVCVCVRERERERQTFLLVNESAICSILHSKYSSLSR